MACAECNSFGFMMDRDGNVEACDACGHYGEDDDAAVEHFWTFASAVVRELLPPAHAPTDECRGCAGFDLFDCHGSTNQRRLAVLCCHDCGVYEGDQDAQRDAHAAFMAQGGVVVDGA